MLSIHNSSLILTPSVINAQHHMETPVLDLLNNTNFFETDIDVLTLSCCKQRIFKTLPGLDIEHSGLLDKIIPHDHEKAQRIREYYSKKIVYWTLKSLPLTSFRQELNVLIHDTGRRTSYNHKGMVCRLPYLFDYDQTLENIKATYFPYQTFSLTDNNCLLTEILYPIATVINPIRKSLEPSMEFWFSTETTNNAARIIINSKNPLLTLWQKVFETKTPLQVTGDFKLVQYDTVLQNYTINKWNLLSLVEVKNQ